MEHTVGFKYISVILKICLINLKMQRNSELYDSFTINLSQTHLFYPFLQRLNFSIVLYLILLIKGNGIYVNMGDVVIDPGNAIIDKPVDTIRDCESLCDHTIGCESFIYCEDSPTNECYLKDKILTGNEPTTEVEKCSSYYTAGNSS